MSTIVVAEDSATDMAMMCSLLQQAGHEVIKAGNGCEAIAQVREQPPDAIVTDLQMPEMDGEELVRHVIDQFPEIPIVLATAHGSERLAADALAGGAVNFVPKASVASLLPGVVRRTLDLSSADRTYRDVPGQLRNPEFYYKLETRIAAIEPAVKLLTQVLSASRSMRPCDRMRIGTAVASAIFNAVCYGNLELTDEDERIQPLLGGDRTSGPIVGITIRRYRGSESHGSFESIRRRRRHKSLGFPRGSRAFGPNDTGAGDAGVFRARAVSRLVADHQLHGRRDPERRLQRSGDDQTTQLATQNGSLA